MDDATVDRVADALERIAGALARIARTQEDAANVRRAYAARKKIKRKTRAASKKAAAKPALD
jgi:hypothetical protein